MGGDEVTGLVFDLPEEPWTREIQRLRLAHDPGRSHFPVEITVAGSSGLGWFAPGQSHDAIAAQVQEIAKGVASFQCHFAGVEVFPNSQVHYLSLKDEEPFHNFQRVLAASRLRFEPILFSYKPHCTIVALERVNSPNASVEVAAFPVPRHGITICSVSLYSVNPISNSCRFLSRFPLGA